MVAVTSEQAYQIFELLVYSLPDRYRAKLTNDLTERPLMTMLTFADNNLQLELHSLEYNRHYVVVMSERDGKVYRAWMLGVSYTGFCAVERKKFDSPHLCQDCAELLTSINHDPGRSGFVEKSSRTLIRAMHPYLPSAL